MAQTSNTEAVAISHLKHLNGIPLGTTTTLRGPSQGGAACPSAGCPPRPPSWARATRPRCPTSLASQRLVLRDENRVLREILVMLYII